MGIGLDSTPGFILVDIRVGMSKKSSVSLYCSYRMPRWWMGGGGRDLISASPKINDIKMN